MTTTDNDLKLTPEEVAAFESPKFPLTDAGVDKCFDEMLKRKFPRHADGKGVEDWTIDPRYLKEIRDLIPNKDFYPSWEEIEQVLLALERMK